MGTTGRLELSPNAVNSVPRGATLEIDVRDIDGERRDATVASIVKEAAAIAKRRKVKHTVSVINQDPPATCSDEVRRRRQRILAGTVMPAKSRVPSLQDTMVLATV